MRCVTCGRPPTQPCCTQCHRAQEHAEQAHRPTLGPRIDETGNRYGRLTVLTQAQRHPTGAIQWLCQCDCGNQTTTKGTYLRNGDTKSCGCLKADHARQMSNAIR